MKFRTILADPPWDYRNRGRGSEKNHYCTLSAEDICCLPVGGVAAENSVLLLWATWPQLPVCLEVIARWGYSYKTAVPWVKVDRFGIPIIGLGFYARACSEVILISTRGADLTPAEGDRPVGVLLRNRGRHSAKPDEQYSLAEAYGGPYLEMFARPDGALFPHREGWTRIGNEITGRDIADDLRLLAEVTK